MLHERESLGTQVTVPLQVIPHFLQCLVWNVARMHTQKKTFASEPKPIFPSDSTTMKLRLNTVAHNIRPGGPRRSTSIHPCFSVVLQRTGSLLNNFSCKRVVKHKAFGEFYELRKLYPSLFERQAHGAEVVGKLWKTACFTTRAINFQRISRIIFRCFFFFFEQLCETVVFQKILLFIFLTTNRTLLFGSTS